ncbi:hypothetical protein FJZ31_09130 [Candidatus Poribacteria bacterium]|nr:hypothetical protein [Candidatus Poribacteria bacterium]
MVLKFRFLVGALSLLCLFIPSYTGFGFIERQYTLQEVIDACTNIVFGTVEAVDVQKLRAVVKVEEDVMGKSELQKIRINLAVGQHRPESTPEEMIKYFHEGKPVIFFYDKHSGQLNSLGHVGGKWFQCKTFVGEGNDWQDRWWEFTHIEIHMHRTFQGWTDDLQKQVREILHKTKPILVSAPAPGFDKASENHLKVLIFSNRKYPAELRTLQKISEIDKYRFAYQSTYDQNLPGLESVDILWLGYRALGEGEYRLNQNLENRIKEFVKNGGILISSGQDSNSTLGWFTGRFKGVESETQMGIHPNEKADDIFQKPNKVATENIYTGDSWNSWGKRFTLLATTNDGRNVAVGFLKYGKGMYLITSMHNETFFQASSNGRLMENLICFAAKNLDTSTLKLDYASTEADKPEPVAHPAQWVSAIEDKSESTSTHDSIPKKTNEKSKDELELRIDKLQQEFIAIRQEIDQFEEASRRDEGRSDELENRISKLQKEFSAIRKNINQLEEESRRDVDKSQFIKQEEAKGKEIQSNSTALPSRQVTSYNQEIDDIFSELQRKIDQFNQTFASEFSNSSTELQTIERRLEQFRQSVDNVRGSFTELNSSPEK